MIEKYKLRNIFSTKPETIQQGCVFSGGRLDEVGLANVYGLIITPRCDIAQNKVRTIHYVPIISFKDWERHFLLKEYQETEKSKKENQIIPVLNKIGLSHLKDVTFQLEEHALKKLLIGKNVSKNFATDLTKYWTLFDDVISYKELHSWKSYENKIYDLIGGKMERFLLLEDWNNHRSFKVICLTEINKILLTTAKKLVDGIKVRDIDFDNNELWIDDNPLREYKVEISISSPYMEYVGQKISNALFRIGIEDWNPSNKDVYHILMNKQ